MATDCCDCLPCKVTEEEYLLQIQQLLPRGVIWDLSDPDREFTKFWQAIADQLAVTNNKLCDFDELLHPCYSEELLNRNAVIWGYPVECIGYPESVEKLCQWLGLIWSDCNPASLEFLQMVVDFVGLEGVELSEHVCTPIDCNCPADECQGIILIDKVAGYLVVTIDRDNLNWDIKQSGAGCCFNLCGPLCDWSIPGFECLMRRFLPAHVEITYKEA